MIISDYHVHSEFSGDSIQNIDELISKAISMGLEEIAITDHLEYDMEGIPGKWILDLESYTQKIGIMKEKYRKDIEIKLGVEIGIQPHTKEYLEEKIKMYPFDFVINSSHAINRIDLAFGEIQEGRTKEEVQALYFDNVLKNVELYNKFNVYGHLDFITRYGGDAYKGLNYEIQRDIIDEILKKIISKGKGIEINTSGYRYREDRFYPYIKVLNRYFELGGEIITVGSDAHKKEDVAKDFDIVYDFLRNAGKKYICSFKKMEPIFKKI